MPKALLVTDAEWVKNDVLASVTMDDWEVSITAHPASIVDQVIDEDPEVVIVDMQVGSMGGMAVIRAINSSLDPDQRPRTILLLDREADTFLGRRAGADECVLKPFTAQQLREKLEAAGPSAVVSQGPRKSRPKS